MRAIDADALIQKAYDEAKGMAEPYDDFGTLVEWLVDKAHTIEPERKKGKWISNDIDPEAWNFCSACGEQAIDLYDFCPNCGAEMTEGEG